MNYYLQRRFPSSNSHWNPMQNHLKGIWRRLGTNSIKNQFVGRRNTRLPVASVNKVQYTLLKRRPKTWIVCLWGCMCVKGWRSMVLKPSQKTCLTKVVLLGRPYWEKLDCLVKRESWTNRLYLEAGSKKMKQRNKRETRLKLRSNWRQQKQRCWRKESTSLTDLKKKRRKMRISRISRSWD